MREDLTKNGTRIPLLGSLPTIGGLFGSKDERAERREILVLVTPRIVHDDEMHTEGEEAACEFHRRQNVFGDSMSPVGRTYLGRKYFRLAQEAWAAGDRERAKRYVDLSIHINPSDRAAIDLRTDIVAGVKRGAHTLHAGVPQPTMLPAGPVILDEHEVELSAPRLLPPEIEQVPATQSTPEDDLPAEEPAPLPPSSRASAPPQSKAPTARRIAFPVRPGRKR
jgi:hypothetical protein